MIWLWGYTPKYILYDFCLHISSFAASHSYNAYPSPLSLNLISPTPSRPHPLFFLSLSPSLLFSLSFYLALSFSIFNTVSPNAYFSIWLIALSPSPLASLICIMHFPFIFSSSSSYHGSANQNITLLFFSFPISLRLLSYILHQAGSIQYHYVYSSRRYDVLDLDYETIISFHWERRIFIDLIHLIVDRLTQIRCLSEIIPFPKIYYMIF